MHYAILIERSYADDEVVAVHEVPYGLELPLGPQMVGSLDSFTVGVRAGVSSKDKKHHRTTPAWGPTALYSRQQNLEEWEEVHIEDLVEEVRSCACPLAFVACAALRMHCFGGVRRAD